MTKDELLVAYAEGSRDFRSADLRGADLFGAYLSSADLSSADLRSADLSNANLRGANLSSAYLSSANLRDANLRGANLRGANLRGADLSSANLYGANLRGANLFGANLYGADLRDADLRGADLHADLHGAYLSPFQIPQEGTLTVWKKLMCGVLAKCLVPETAKRTASLVGRKCRAESLIVLELIGAAEGMSQHDRNVVYRVGETVVPDSYDPDIRVECSNGIHFFLTREEAEAY